MRWQLFICTFSSWNTIFFLHSEVHCNLRLHSCWWWRGQLQWRRRYSRRNSYWRGLDGRTCSKVWPVRNVAIKLCGENIIHGSSSTLPLNKRWLRDWNLGTVWNYHGGIWQHTIRTVFWVVLGLNLWCILSHVLNWSCSDSLNVHVVQIALFVKVKSTETLR